MSIESQNLDRIIKTTNPVGKVAITTQKTGANKSINEWSHSEEIPTGTAVLVMFVENRHFVKVVWEGKSVFVKTNHLRLVEINNAFNGKSFVVTGELTVPREFFKNLVTLKGGIFKSAISGKCDYLVVGFPTRSKNSIKLKKALQAGVQIITEQQFFTLIASGE